MGDVHLSIGTSAQGDRINLVDPFSQIVASWEPSETPLTDTFSESSLGDGRVLSSYREENAIEDMSIHLKSSDPDGLIKVTQVIRRMLIKARDYWVTPRQGLPVYIAARGACETNKRYALVYTGAVPSDIMPWGYEFARANVMSERQLVLERGPWTDNPPGTGGCVDVQAGSTTCYPNYLDFDGVDAYVNCHSDAQLDHILGQNQFMEVDAWIWPGAFPNPESGYGGRCTIMAKADYVTTGWWFSYDNSDGSLEFYINFAVQQGQAITDPGVLTLQAWNHVYCCIEMTTVVTPIGKRPYIAVNGVWQTPASVLTGSGALPLDDAYDFFLGMQIIAAANSAHFWGKMMNARARNTITRTVGVDFDPPTRCLYPMPDANVVGQWIHEGTGVQTGNDGTGATEGSLLPIGPPYSGPAWGCDCPQYYGSTEVGDPPVEPVLDPGTFVNTFYKPVGAAPVVQDLAFGFKPQAVIFWGAPNVSGSDVVVIDVENTFGIAALDTDGLITQGSMGWGARDGLINNPLTTQRHTQTAAITIYDNNGVLQAEASVTSFNDFGVTLTWTANNASAWPFHVAAFRSRHLADVYVKTWRANAGAGADSVAGVPFQPTAFLDFGGGLNSAALPWNRTAYYAGLGGHDGTNEFGSGWAGNVGGGLGSLSNFVQDVGSFHYMPNPAAVPSVRARFDFTAFTADGMNFNITTAPGFAYWHSTLFMTGTNFAVGTFTQPVGGGAQSIATVGFKPDLLLLFFNGSVSGAAVGPPNNPSFGACDENLNMAATCGFDNRVNPSECSRVWSNVHAIMDMTSLGAVRAAAVVTSLDALGFSLDWTTWAAPVHPGFYIAIKVN